MKYKCFAITFFALLNLNLYSSNNQGYRIKVHAPFKEGSMAYFANYWEGKSYTIDSMRVEKGKDLLFSSDSKNLETGQYLLYIEPDIQMELLLEATENNIEIAVDSNYLSNSRISGSKNTQLFWNYLNKYTLLNQGQQSLHSKINNSETEDEKKEAINTLKKLQEQEKTLTAESINANTDTWFATFIRAMQPVLPPHIVPSTKAQAMENKQYIKEHFFDNIDMEDVRLWRTSFFLPQIENYISQWIPQYIDTIAKETSWIVSKTKDNDAAFEKMLSYMVNSATTSKVMGMENVWAKLAEDYIFDKKPNWISEKQYNDLKAEYSLIEYNRLGMKALSLNLKTIDGDSINTNDIDAEYLVLYFYSPTCNHCATEIPKLRNDIYLKYKDKGFKVIAINVDNNIDRWTSFIESYNIAEWINVFDPNFKSEYWLKYNTSGTPSLYLLNKDKTILAKKIDADNLDKYLSRIIE